MKQATLLFSILALATACEQSGPTAHPPTSQSAHAVTACAAPPTGWVERHSACATPSPRIHVGMAYDEARHETVMFGGYAGALVGETWTWDGRTWEQKFPLTSPPPRQEIGMAFDVVSQRVVIFGGIASGSYLSDTWAWDGHDWSQVTTTASPAPRQNGAMAMDPVRGTVVLFGGQGNGGLLGDTWEFDGSDWTQITPTDPQGDGNPAARQHHRMAYDTIAQRVVLCGGDAGGDECWAWDGSSWDRRPDLPRAVFGAGLATHPWLGSGGVIQFGGRTGSTYGLQEQVLLTPSSATLQSLNPIPGPRFYFGMAYDSHRDVIVAFGGYTPSLQFTNDTWEL